MRELITAFSEFEKIYETVKADLSIDKIDEATKFRATDTSLKAKDENKKIKIITVQPKDSGEKYRFEFKVVATNAETNNPKLAALGALAEYTRMLINKGNVDQTMVGFLNIEEPRQRLLGDFISTGVLSFYDRSTLPNISQIQSIYKYPFNQTSASPAVANIQNTVATPGKAVNTSVNSTDLLIYNFSDLPIAKGPTGAKINMQELVKPNANQIPEPGFQSTPQVQNTEVNQNVQNIQQPGKLSYSTLTKSLTPNPLVKDLQARIIALGQTDTAVQPAATLLTGKGGADGKYGSATAQAIGLLTGKPEVDTIDQATSDALIKLLGAVTPEQISAVTAKVTPEVVHTVQNQENPEQSNKSQSKPKQIEYRVKTNNSEIPELIF